VTENPPPLRGIRSFVRREGRFTPGQRRALAELWPRFGISPTEMLDLPQLFGRSAPTVLEIGFGNGATLAAMAAAAPEKNFLGVEVHRPGVGGLLQRLAEQGLSNVRVVQTDAKALLEQCIPDASLDAVYLFFPDPWPKKRHHKRRLLQTEFAQLVRRKLVVGGIFHAATDWAPYAEHMLEVLTAASDYTNLAGPGAYAPRPGYRPLTKFEARGQRLGHGVWDLLFQRIA
jgi:tRNA (guanine-N7-)-methyltransferase